MYNNPLLFFTVRMHSVLLVAHRNNQRILGSCINTVQPRTSSTVVDAIGSCHVRLGRHVTAPCTNYLTGGYEEDHRQIMVT